MLYETDEGSRQEFLRLLAEQGEEPAFLRRARGLTAALENLDRKLTRERLAMLHGPRLHLRTIAVAVHQDWTKLKPYLRNPARAVDFEFWFEQWNRDMPVPDWAGKHRLVKNLNRPLRDLNASIQRFNKDWIPFLIRYDLTPVNEVIQGYNDYFVLEKACAFGNESLAKKGFERVDEVTHEMILKKFPAIELVELR